MQKFRGPAFVATTKVTVHATNDGDETGLVVMGLDYGYIAVKNKSGKFVIVQTVCHDADTGTSEHIAAEVPASGIGFYLRADADDKAIVRFSYSTDGNALPIWERHSRRAKENGLEQSSACSQPARPQHGSMGMRILTGSEWREGSDDSGVPTQ